MVAIALFTLVLTACFDGHPTHPPQPSPAVALREGGYELHVLRVVSSTCPGQNSRNLVGQELSAALEGNHQDVSMDLSGVPLDGQMAQGYLSLKGRVSMGGPVQSDTDTDVDAPGEKDTGAAADTGADEGDSTEDSGEDSGDCSTSASAKCYAREPRHHGGPAMYVSLEADIDSPLLAEGVMDWELTGPDACAVQAQVALVFSGPSASKPPVVYAEETEAEAEAEAEADTGAAE